MTDRVRLKQMARQNMRTARPSALLVSLLFLALTMLVQTVVRLVSFGFGNNWLMIVVSMNADHITPAEAIRVLSSLGGVSMLSVFLSILVSFFVMVMNFGYYRYCLNLAQGMKTRCRDLTTGFACTGRVLGAQILIFIFCALWTLAVFLPTMFLIFGIVGVTLALGGGGAVWLANTLSVLACIGALIGVFALTLRYAMAFIALADDPELRTLGAIERSRVLMRGRKWEYFKLLFSFFGWYLLAFLIMMVAAVITMFAAMIVAGFAFYGSMVDPGAALSAMNVVLGVTSVVMALAALPFSMWLTPYVNLTVTHYYLEISEPCRVVRQPPLDEDWRPEPF